MTLIEFGSDNWSLLIFLFSFFFSNTNTLHLQFCSVLSPLINPISIQSYHDEDWPDCRWGSWCSCKNGDSAIGCFENKKSIVNFFQFFIHVITKSNSFYECANQAHSWIWRRTSIVEREFVCDLLVGVVFHGSVCNLRVRTNSSFTCFDHINIIKIINIQQQSWMSTCLAGN